MKLKIALAQIKSIAGALEDNFNKILYYWECADQAKSDLIVFPELALCGYHINDLALRTSLQKQCDHYLKRIIDLSRTYNCAAIIGTIRSSNINKPYNSAYVIHQGMIVHLYNKVELPNYGVFDEKRFFNAGTNLSQHFQFNGVKVGILICEDIWYSKHYHNLVQQGIELLIVINASPFSISKAYQRYNIINQQIKSHPIKLIYVNQVGGADHLVFDGRSMIFGHYGTLLYSAVAFMEEMIIINSYTSDSISVTLQHIQHMSKLQHQVDNNSENCQQSYKSLFVMKSSKQLYIKDEQSITQQINDTSDLYQAVMLALKDYLISCNFSDVIIGLSGGIDSALVTAISIDAIGVEHVHLVTMPSRYSSTQTYIDTKDYLQRLSTTAMNIEIEPIFSQYASVLYPKQNIDALITSGQQSSIALENLQARIRGTILMTLSNQYNYMLLSTGNKSEIALGYTTLYGDMNGGYNPLKDLYKTQIYKLAKWRNNNVPLASCSNKLDIIPQSIICKAPTAELRPHQKDSDNLPEYHILDQILYLYIEKSKSYSYIVDQGLDPKITAATLQRIQRMEFKRQQAPLGPKVTDLSFDKDWRYPIVNKFKEFR